VAIKVTEETISVTTGGKGRQLPLSPTGPGLDPEIRANPIRSVNTQWGGVGDEYGKD